jgi:hypothetical protein
MQGLKHQSAQKLLGRYGRTADFGIQRVEQPRHVFQYGVDEILDFPQRVIGWDALIGIKEEKAGRERLFEAAHIPFLQEEISFISSNTSHALWIRFLSRLFQHPDRLRKS